MKIQTQFCRWFRGRVVKALNHINKLERESDRNWWWIEEVRRKGFMRSLESTLLIQRLVNQRIAHVATRLPVNLSLNRSMTSSAGRKDSSQKLMVYGDTAMCCVVCKFIEVNSLMLLIFSFYPPLYTSTHTLYIYGNTGSDTLNTSPNVSGSKMEQAPKCSLMWLQQSCSFL